MTGLVVVLAVFLCVGLAQTLLAGRMTDAIHGGPGRREPRGRAMDVRTLRGAGGFIVLVALGGLAIVFFTGEL